jgi:beta-lactam-binding protein with PASTA domain
VMSGTPVSPPRGEMRQHTRHVGGATMVAPPASAIAGHVPVCGEEPPGGGRRRAAWWALLGGAALAVVIVAGYLVLAGGAGGKKYAVPQVTGLTYQQASQQILASHLHPQRIGQSSHSVGSGRVIGTSPHGGAMVAANSVVKVFVSAGQQRAPVTVPNVVGEDAGAAQAKLANAGLNPVVKTDTTSTAPANIVVTQDPAAGAKVTASSDVTIDVSAGGTKVQDVTGDRAGPAKNILQGQGFQVNQVYQPATPSAPPGTVYAQNPPAGTLLAQGKTVTIYIQPAAKVTVANPGTQTGTVGAAASLQIQASDSASGQRLTYSANGLPAGLSISSSSGLISGAPTTAGPATVAVTVTDTSGASASTSFTWTINSSSTSGTSSGGGG